MSFFRSNNNNKPGFLEVKKYSMKIILFSHLVVVELDEEEYDEGIEVGVRVNPEWDSSHE